MTLTLNIAPVTFDADQVTLGRLPYNTDEEYERLRETHRESHVLRFDQRDGTILNVPVSRHVAPLGDVSVESVNEHLFLLSKAMQHALVRWLRPRRILLSRARPVTFWGGNREAKLLEQAVRAAGADPRPDLDVRVRYTFDTRLLPQVGSEQRQLGLVIDLGTSNVVEIPADQLLAQGFALEGCRVCRRPPSPDEWFRPHLEALGWVRQVREGVLLLADARDAEEVLASEVMLEPTQSMLERVVTRLYGHRSARILKELVRLRTPYSQAPTKLQLIQQTLDALREDFECQVAGGLRVQFGNLLTRRDSAFPPLIDTERPILLFGAQGTQTGRLPDEGIRDWGPYHYTQHAANEPVIGVICESRHRGRMDIFLEMLRSGFPETEWERAHEGRSSRRPNPFKGGLIQKFRLQRVTYEFEEIGEPTAAAYQAAIDRLLRRLPTRPALAVVQTQARFRELPGVSNPYFVTKVGFMMEGVPVQTIHIEKVEASRTQLPYILNSVALASYAKMKGIPWLLSTREPASHELVIGLGYSEVRGRRPGDRRRFVGLTTLFYGDGRYGLWGLTREVAFEDYAAALLESLRVTIRVARDRHGWQDGDSIRLIFHVYKPLKREEIKSIRQLVGELLQDRFTVKFAFLDLSSHHPFNLFEPSAAGQRYGAGHRGVGVPARGVALQFDKKTALLHLTGPGDLKTDLQGMPQPLLLELHEDSDFTDLVYLVRQVYAFSYLSWRSFMPGTEPVTMSYSRRIANVLGNLATIDGWDARALARGPLRDSQWFL